MRRRTVLAVVAVLALGVTLMWAEQKWQAIGVLSTEAFSGETLLWVDYIEGAQATPDQAIMLESRDGSTKEIHKVLEAHGNYIVLDKRLKNDFPGGSRCYQ